MDMLRTMFYTVAVLIRNEQTSSDGVRRVYVTTSYAAFDLSCMGRFKKTALNESGQ